MTTTDLAGRTAIVTGAGAGLGRAEAVALATRGANVVVNDMGDAALSTVSAIESLGARAIAVAGDVGRWDVGQQLVEAAVDTFGGLDIVVNNAGITRDAMLFNMSEQNWDDVIKVHLKGHAAVSRAASVYFRAAAKSAGRPGYARIINTASEAFLFGAAGQSNYAAAKAGIVALTLSTCRGLARYGVTANAICPRARTEMTSNVFAEDRSGGELDILSPDRVGAFVTYLASPAAATISGQVFVVYGDFVALMAPPTVEHIFRSAAGAFTVDELHTELAPYFQDRSEQQTFAAFSIAELDNTGVASLNG